MTVENWLMKYKDRKEIVPDNQKIEAAVKKSLDVFYLAEQERMLSYHEFLWTQLKLIQKRWWILQFLLLLILWFVLRDIEEDFYIQRSLGIIASLFVILVIPEFWKNRGNQCMEIEAVSYFPLRQIYAARLLLFGIVDLFLLTVFCGAATITLHLELLQLTVQFLFPLSVTAGICFGTLCSNHSFSEASAVALCVLWSAVWLLIVLNETIYTKVTPPIWIALIGVAILYIFSALYRLLKNCTQYWEVLHDGSEI